VRGKVVGFRINDPNIGATQKAEAMKEAKAYFRIAAKYAKNL
jgi:aminoglycoside phosphotransferase family enzyme